MKHYKINRKKRNFRKKNINFSFLKKKFFWFFCLGIILISGFIYFFIYSEVFKIKEIQVLSSSEYLKVNIEKIVNQELNKNIFLLKSKEINTKILNQFPEVLELELKKKMPDIFMIQVKERQEVAVLCSQDYSQCFSIDKDGSMFRKIKSELKKDQLIISLGGISQNFIVGESFLLKDRITDFLEIEKILKNNLKIEIEDIVVISAKRLNLKTREGWEIYFSLEKDIKLQTTKLRVLLEQEILIEARKNLEYIDLRFERIFYK